MTQSYIVRYTFGERVAQGLATLCFIYLLLSGLSLRMPIFYGLAMFCGGPSTSAWLHPLVGILYFGFILWLFSFWAPSMRMTRADGVWRSLREYASAPPGEPSTGDRLHAGQKVLLWLQVGATFLLFFSGTVLWFPGSFPAGLRGLGLFLHEIGFILVTAGMMLPAYRRLVLAHGAGRRRLHDTTADARARGQRSRWFRDPRRP